MAQDVQIIDIRRSYVPIDPNAFPVTMLDATGEDNPETRVPVVPYDGYNFMPTPQGYASYFGLNSTLGIATLIASGGTGKVDDIFMIQTLTLDNVLVALCDDGIWTKSATVAGNWTHTITLAVPAVGVHLQWSKCVLENEVIAYRQGGPGHYKATPANSYVFTLEVPTFLNMAGQLGIFKAGGRLGYWDSENSIGWSALGFTQDFVPDLETLAGNTIFQDIVGRIVVVHQHGTGFVVYCTKSIVAVSRNVGSPMLWQGKSLFNNNGISYREEAVYSEPDVTHFAYTTQGIVQISGQITQSGSSVAAGEFISPEVSTYLREKRDPVYLQIMNGRYLFFKMLNAYYMNGEITFNREDIPVNTLSFGSAVAAIDGVETTGDTTKAMLAVESTFDTYWIKKHLNKDRYEDANGIGSVPIWEDHIASSIGIAFLNAYKATGPSLSGSPNFFDQVLFATGGIPKVTGGNEFFIPTANRSLKLVAGYTPIDTISANEHAFWNKQDWIWFYERSFTADWKEAIYRKVHNPVAISNVQGSMTENLSGSFIQSGGLHTFGPYVDLSYFSESNLYYGSAEKSAWTQRSLIKGIIVEVEETTTTFYHDVVESLWIKPSPSMGDMTFAFASNPANGQAILNARFPPPGPPTYTFHHLAITGTLSGDSLNIAYFATVLPSGPAVYNTQPYLTPNFNIFFDSGSQGPIFNGFRDQTQKFSTPRFIPVDLPPCMVKNLGFTKIIGHGHYTSLGNFIQDDSITEAPDYQDQCLPIPPLRKKHPEYNGITIGQAGFPGFGAPVVISGTLYQFPPDIVNITIPGGSILLQIGSIEPIYPTFQGAFVFDIHYKKWGKMKQPFKRLLDYFPINDVAGDKVVPYDVFLPRGALLGEDGIIYLFDQFPSDSYITYGKIGFYRKGFTQSEEIRIVNRALYNGSVILDASITSGDINPALTISRSYVAAKEFVAYAAQSGRWYNVTIEGNYDLMHLEFRGHKTGHR